MSSVYKTWAKEEIENLLSQFIINSWSYSKVTTFARNEAAFERSYIYNDKSRVSSTTIAGQAYHYALKHYFGERQHGSVSAIVTLQTLAYEYIEDVKPNVWKIQKTTPCIDDCMQNATTVANALLNHFIAEVGIYIDEIKRIVDVEVYCNEWLTVNGVDIPLPCSAVIDLVIETHSGKLVIIDHKSKKSFSDEKEVKFVGGVQAITYVLSYEEKTGMTVDEVWFIENKSSANRDKSQQLIAFKIPIDENARRLYEYLLYAPLKRMIEAVNNPDYIYLINNTDSYEDMAELYNFVMRVMIADIGEFNIDPLKRDLIAKRMKKVKDSSIDMITPNIIKKFKEEAAAFIQFDLSTTNMTNEEKIEHLLRTFNILVKVAHKIEGYSSDTYLLEFGSGVKINSIYGHRLDLANGLNVSNVRIPIALSVFKDKAYLPVEVSKKRERDLLFSAGELSGMQIPVGRNNLDEIVVWDLNNHSTPHVLTCGATGSGKSVFLRSTIEFAKLAGIDDIDILDPKYEFVHLKGQFNVINDIAEIEARMAERVKDMNNRVKKGTKKMTLMVFDEFADAIAQSRSGNDLKIYTEVRVGKYANGKPKMELKHTSTDKSLEENMRILLQKGRSCGFRIIAATQRASVKVITGDAKVNFPVQICFKVPKEADSRVVIDEAGAETLGGQGDGLIRSPQYNSTVRFQAYFLQ